MVTRSKAAKAPAKAPAKRAKTPARKAPAPVKKAKTSSGSAKTVKPAAKKPSPPKAAAKSKTPASKAPARASRQATRKRSPSPSPPPKVAKKAAAPAPAKADSKMVTMIKKGAIPVDAECPRAGDCHVYEGMGKVWAATLNQTNIGNNANKYYIVQALQTDDNSQFLLWTRWGRVGFSGQNALQGPFGSASMATSQFESKLKAKTRGGYKEIDISYEPDDEEEKTQKKPAPKTSKQKESKLDKRVQELIKLICDVNILNKTLTEIGYDAKKMPLGKLSGDALKQGYTVLKQIEAEMKTKNQKNLQDLSSQFYTLIPHDFGFRHMSMFVIKTPQQLKEKIQMIENLSDMKIASSLISGTTESGDSIIDQHYKKLNCRLTPVEKNSKDFKICQEYMKNTHGSTHNQYTLEPLDVFVVDRPNEESRYTKNLGNDMLLWHGSRVTNFVGILSQGLRIAPPEAPVTGYMFGKGIYFADMVSKSANYCWAGPSNNIGCMLLCEVALGNPNEKLFSDYNAAKLPSGKSSTKGVGRTAPPESSYIPHGRTKVPIGKGTATATQGGTLLYNEYIVYNLEQVKMKYIIRTKFNFNR